MKRPCSRPMIKSSAVTLIKDGKGVPPMVRFCAPMNEAQVVSNSDDINDSLMLTVLLVCISTLNEFCKGRIATGLIDMYFHLY